jgi:hypothetical protein
MNTTKKITKKSKLIFFRDADEDAELKMLDLYAWKDIKDFFSRQME